jgi:hypothetical protein
MTLDEIERTAKRVLGGAHPVAALVERKLIKARAALRAREASDPGDVSSICAAVEAMAPGDA